MSRANAARDPALEQQLRHELDGATTPEILAFSCVGSTMEIAHRLAVDGAPEGTLVWAARQEQGRGRLGRVWSSPKGGAYFSLILHPARPPAEIPQLSLVAGLAAAEAIQQLTGLFPAIRWPNDVLLNGLKVAGILVEARGDAVIVGIGINVTTRTEDLPDTATSLSAARLAEPRGGVPRGGVPSEAARPSRGMPVNPYRLTAELCRSFSKWYDVWTTQGFAPIREALRPWIGLFGHPVHISAGSNRFEGTASDLDEDGRLVVRLDSGVLRAFDMGEVTLLR